MALALRWRTSSSLPRVGALHGAADNPSRNDDSTDGTSADRLGLRVQRESESSQGLPASRSADATNRSHVTTYLKTRETGSSPSCGGGRPSPKLLVEERA